MKKFIPLFTIALLLLMAGCKKKEKDPLSVPVEFTSTTYQPLGTYDANGTPSYLLTPDVVSSDMQTFINSI